MITWEIRQCLWELLLGQGRRLYIQAYHLEDSSLNILVPCEDSSLVSSNSVVIKDQVFWDPLEVKVSNMVK